MSVSPAEIIEKLRGAPQIGDPRLPDHLAKAGTFTEPASATSGPAFYDLELGAKLVYPVLTPLRNSIPRLTGGRGVQAAWRAITAINTGAIRAGVSESNRGGTINVATKDYVANYKGIGIESSASFEATYAAQGFDDLRALAARTGLESLMLQEEAMILGGNGSLALGAPGAVTVSAATTGGTLAAQTWSVIAVPLALDGVINASVTGGIQQALTRTNADGTSDTFGGGAGFKSAATTVTTTSATSSITASIPTLNGALGYAWFWGASGAEVLGAITTINSVSITAAATGTQTAASLIAYSNGATDYSVNNLAFDGLITQALANGSGAYVKYLDPGAAGVGTPLTADGQGGIVEIDTALKWFWDNYRLSPDTLWVNSKEALNISRKILQGTSNSAMRFVFNSAQDAIGGGIMVRTYLNRFSMAGPNVIDIKIHPNMPAGTILMTSASLPYPLSNVANVMQIRCRQDYYQIMWPVTSRKYPYGVYADEVLQHYFPPSMGVITNIANG